MGPNDPIPRTDTIVVGYHATSAANIASILRDGKFFIKSNDWDWLGHGIYFWQDAPSRAWQWAMQKFPGSPGVIVAKIRLGVCLDLCDSAEYRELVSLAHKRLEEAYAKVGKPLPVNTRKRHDLDCMVFNYLTSEIKPVDTLRAIFQEGNKLYSGTSLGDQDHIQICVKNPTCILEIKQFK